MPTERPQGPAGDLLLRPGTPEDMEEIAELFLATRRDAVPQMPAVISDDETIRAWFRAHASTHEYWVAQDGQLEAQPDGQAGGDILGYAMLDGAWLDALYVGPDCQGSGVGEALLDLVKAQRPEGFGLWVFASNDRARSFYHRNGLIELEHTDGSGNAERSPDVRMVWPGTDPLRFLRDQIDGVDGELALLLARRFALTAAVQGVKDNPGRSGRDSDREAEIAARMAAHAPGLGVAAISRIMHTVIEESLDAYERGR